MRDHICSYGHVASLRRWPALTRLLSQYVQRTLGVDAANRLRTDRVYHRKMLLSCGHLVVNYFDARTVNYYSTVLKVRRPPRFCVRMHVRP